MGFYKNEDIVGYRVGEEMVCDECITEDEMDALEEGDLILESNKEDGYYFCDRCKKQI